MVLYHITPRKNLDSIMEHGIIPNHSKGISRYHEYNKVFLTNDVERIFKEQAGERWIKDNDPVILK